MVKPGGQSQPPASQFVWCLVFNKMPEYCFCFILILGAWYTERLGQVLVCREAGHASYLQKCKGITKIHLSSIKSILKLWNKRKINDHKQEPVKMQVRIIQHIIKKYLTHTVMYLFASLLITPVSQVHRKFLLLLSSINCSWLMFLFHGSVFLLVILMAL